MEGTQQTYQNAFIGSINAKDAIDAREYIAEETTKRGWKPRTVKRQQSVINSFLTELNSKELTLAQLDKVATLELVTRVQQHPRWSEDTKQSNWDLFQRFYKWAFKKHGRKWNEEAKTLILGDELEKRWQYKKDHNRITKKATFTVDEMQRLLSIETEPCYRAFLGTTFECGLRIGEALSLQIQDVRKSDMGFDIEVRSSKTAGGKRTVFMEQYFVPLLDKWLGVHPQRTNPKAKLFLNSFGKPLEQKTANKRLKKLAKRALPHYEKVCIHSLRHSWATHCANFMTDAAMKSFFGWEGNSDMPSVYIRLQKIDIRRAMRQARGLEVTKETDESKKCLKCSLANSAANSYCSECQSPLDLKEYLAVQERERAKNALSEAMEQMSNVFRDRFADYDAKIAKLIELKKGGA